MSVDFNECNFCYESKIDDYCYYRIIDGLEVCACNYCINDKIKNGELIKFDEDSEEYSKLSNKDKEDIRNYGSMYRRTDKGTAKRLKEIDQEIKLLQKEKDKLLSK